MAFTWRAPRSVTDDPDDPRTGYFENADWDPDSPGIFAWIAGVSDYPFMVPDPGPGRRNYGFTHGLYVSALTAHRVVDWLIGHPGAADPKAEVARVWFQAAPTAAELDHAPELAADEHNAASFDVLRDSIRDWSQALDAANPESHGLFFFSGHGVTYDGHDQLLLPSDWPDPDNGAEGVNDVVAVGHLIKALRSRQADQILFLIDACWANGVDHIEYFGYNGAPILASANDPRAVNSNQRQPILHASAVSQSTMQPDHPDLGLSIFGQAVIEALADPGGTPPSDCGEDLCPVVFWQFVEDVKARVAQRMNANDLSPLPLLTDDGKRASTASVTWKRPPPGDDDDGDDGRDRAGAMQPAEEERLSEHHEYVLDADRIRAVGTSTLYDEVHDRLGHESIAWPTLGLQLVDPATGQVLDADFEIRAIRHDPLHNEVRYDLAIDRFSGNSSGNVWAIFADPHGVARSRAVSLPVDERRVFQIMHTDVPGAYDIGMVDVRLSNDNDDTLAEVARRWRRLLDASAHSGFGDDGAEELVEAVRRKGAGPNALLAAEVAAAALRQADSDRVPTQWLANLWINFGSIDGAVLWMDRTLNQPSDEPSAHLPSESIIDEAADRLVDDLVRVGMPRLRITTGLLFSIVEEFPALFARVRAALQQRRPLLQQRGLFATYAGWTTQLGPWVPNLAFPAGGDRYAFLERYGYAAPPELDMLGPAPLGIESMPVPEQVQTMTPVVVDIYRRLAADADHNGFVSPAAAGLRSASGAHPLIEAGLVHERGAMLQVEKPLPLVTNADDLFAAEAIPLFGQPFADGGETLA